MSVIAVFPGQGSQVIGMGMEIAKKFKSAQHVFDEVDNALNFKLSKVMKDGDEETLMLTKNAQPALMATGIAVVKTIEELTEKKISDIVSHAAGHSLGEYTALVSAGSLSISDAAKLLKTRGEAMQNAVPVGQGSMVAILGVSVEDIEYFIAARDIYAHALTLRQWILPSNHQAITKNLEKLMNCHACLRDSNAARIIFENIMTRQKYSKYLCLNPKI